MTCPIDMISPLIFTIGFFDDINMPRNFKPSPEALTLIIELLLVSRAKSGTWNGLCLRIE
jgi:hypothetical protein